MYSRNSINYKETESYRTKQQVHLFSCYHSVPNKEQDSAAGCVQCGRLTLYAEIETVK
jgi:hypothetical protein